MKRIPIISILYYGFTVIFGIVLTFFWFLSAQSLKINNALVDSSKNGDAFKITQILTVYQNKDVVAQDTLADGSKFVIYEVDATYSETIDSKTVVKLDKNYVGIVTNLGDGWKKEKTNNKDGLVTNQFGIRFNGKDINGSDKSIDYRIGYAEGESLKENEKNIYISRYTQYTLTNSVIFSISEHEFEKNEVEEINSISFINNDSSTYETKEVGNLSFESSFFDMVEEFNNKYNASTDNNEKNTLAEQSRQEFIDAGYSVSIYADLVKYVYVESTFKVILYFVIILIIGDFLVGKHYILEFFKKLFKFKKKEKEYELPDYMKEYEVNVEFIANVPDHYSKDITIRYNNENGDVIELVLTKANGYKASKRYKNGVYNELDIISAGAKCVDVPSQINVSGLKYSQVFVFERVKEEISNEKENN